MSRQLLIDDDKTEAEIEALVGMAPITRFYLARDTGKFYSPSSSGTPSTVSTSDVPVSKVIFSRRKTGTGLIVNNSKVDFDISDISDAGFTYLNGDITIGPELDGKIFIVTAQLEGGGVNNRAELGLELHRNGSLIPGAYANNYSARNNIQADGGVTLANFPITVATGEVYSVQAFEDGANPTYKRRNESHVHRTLKNKKMKKIWKKVSGKYSQVEIRTPEGLKEEYSAKIEAIKEDIPLKKVWLDSKIQELEELKEAITSDGGDPSEVSEVSKRQNEINSIEAYIAKKEKEIEDLPKEFEEMYAIMKEYYVEDEVIEEKEKEVEVEVEVEEKEKVEKKKVVKAVSKTK